MLTVIEILLGTVFFLYLGKAILETFWGVCLLIAAGFCYMLGCMLRLLAKFL